MGDRRAVEWPTWGVLVATYVVWGLATTWLSSIWLPLGVVFVALSAALHSSLTHEALHGHPTRIKWVNEALVFLALTLSVPYRRFRDTHIAHHHDEVITDPYDDPESNFLDPEIWAAMPGWQKAILRFNNSLFGRLLIGPLIGQICFMRSDWALIRRGDRDVLFGWLWHIPALALVVCWMGWVGQMPVWAFLVATYGSHSILKIRTFLEHRAHELGQGRTVLIEDKGILAFLFLNNNLHIVHHNHPQLAWYELPALSEQNRAEFLDRNDGYHYRSYGDIFRRYFLRAKDPVPHPLFPRR